MEEEAPEPVRWAITTDGNSGERLEMDSNVLDSVKRLGGKTVHVALDDEWLLEPSPSRQQIPKRIPGRLEEDDHTTELGLALRERDRNMDRTTHTVEEEKDSTLKASNQGPKTTPTPSAHATPTRPRPTARLSSIFAATVDTNQHPAPPSTPQMTLLHGAGDVADAIAEALSESDRGLPDQGLDRVSLNELERRFGSPQSDKGKPPRHSSMEISGPARLLFGKSPPTSAISPDTPDPVSSPTPPSPSAHAFVSLSAGSGISLTKLLPQTTGGSVSSTPGGEGWSKRFALPSFGGWMGSPASTMSRSVADNMLPPESGSVRSSAQVSMASSTRTLEKQTTGGLWGWWSGGHQPEEGSAEAFVKGLLETLVFHKASRLVGIC